LDSDISHKALSACFQSDVLVKLRDKETQIVQRINKIHKVAE